MSAGRLEDEQLLLDFLLGRCDGPQAGQVRQRLGAEEDFVRLHRDLSNALAALRLLPEREVPEGLADRTIRRVESMRRADAAVTARETARPWAASTFSLRELLAVAAAVVVMATLFLPSLRQARQRARIGQCASNLGQIGTAVSAYASENGECLPIAADHPYQWLAGPGPTVSNSAALFRLVRQGQVPPEVFACPAVGGESFAVMEGMMDFPAGKFIGYSYQHSLSPEGPLRRDRFSPAEQEHMAIAADDTPLFRDGQFLRHRLTCAVSDNHDGKGQNVLYLNGGVRWADHARVGVADNNIFQVDDLTDYRGDEMPARRTDSFLLPNFVQKR